VGRRQAELDKAVTEIGKNGQPNTKGESSSLAPI